MATWTNSPRIPVASHCRYERAIGFYKGLQANLIRVVPACMITFLVYENVSHYMLAHKKTRELAVIDMKTESSESTNEQWKWKPIYYCGWFIILPKMTVKSFANCIHSSTSLTICDCYVLLLTRIYTIIIYLRCGVFLISQLIVRQ